MSRILTTLVTGACSSIPPVRAPSRGTTSVPRLALAPCPSSGSHDIATLGNGDVPLPVALASGINALASMLESVEEQAVLCVPLLLVES